MATASEDAAILAEFERLALVAGKPVMDIFNSAFAVESKSDSSPVTEADRAAEIIILEGLRTAFPHIPCVAEEEMSSGLAPGQVGDAFFLIDPLDGTKEFIGKKADFTINLALVRDGVPVVGVVYAPAKGVLYGGGGKGAYQMPASPDAGAGPKVEMAARTAGSPLSIVASRSHRTPETETYLEQFPGADIVSVGSSLKFCILAAGEADLYPRFGRTMEWDTAAGDAVLRAAGGSTATIDGQPLRYGKRNQKDDTDFANPWFISKGRA